jgi:hypothetical protein
MSQIREGSDRKTVPCAQCRKEVPVSEAKVAEAADYVMYFCGLQCYAEWAKHAKGPESAARKD